MNSSNWVVNALAIFGAMGGLWGIIQYFLNRGRKQASVGISRTENQIYKNIIENKLAELNLQEIITERVKMEVKELKDMLWDAQKEHYGIKLEMQERLLASEKEKNEIMREKQLLANEHQDCQLQIDSLTRKVEMLERQIKNKQ